MLKYHSLSKKTLVLSIIFSKCENEGKKKTKEEKKSMKIFRILGLIEDM